MPESSIKCPICGRTVLLADPQAPFCSERCRLLDLGNWASGRYQIAGPLSDDDPDSSELPEADQKDLP